MKSQIVNIVSILCTDTAYNLDKIKSFYSESKYNPGRFSGLSLKLSHGTALVFSTGKITLVGVKSESLVNLMAIEVCNKLAVVGYDPKLQSTKIVNIVTSIKLPFRLNLIEFARYHPRTASYEQELFPGLKYQMDNNLVATVFTSGNCFVTGSKSFKEASDSCDRLHLELSLFQM